MIEVRAVTKKFEDFTAIQDITLSVAEKSIYGLVGYNGAGKTTLLKIIADVYRPEKGEVLVSGEKIYDNAKMKRTIFFVPDDIFFTPNANLEKMAKFYKGYYPNFEDHIMESLANVFGLSTTVKINGFSKGMQRQAEFILGLASRPRVLLLDESFDGLDPQKRSVVAEILKEYVKKENSAVIISSHNLHELGNLCDFIGIINGKRLTHDHKVSDLVSAGNRYRVLFNEPIEKEVLFGLEVQNFKSDAKLVNFISMKPRAEVEAKLSELHSLSVEVFPLSVEEIFLNEMEGEVHDYSKIFG